MVDFTKGGSPVDGQDEMNRGGTVVLDPPAGPINPETGHDEGQNKTIVEVRSRCLAGVAINVIFDLTLEGQSNESQVMIQDEFIMAQVKATLTWGLGGAKYKAEVDVLQGTQLSINAEDLLVQVRYVRDTRPWDPSESEIFPRFRVNAAFGYNGIGRNSNPARFSQLVQIQQPQGSQRIQIPKYAVSATLLPFNGADVTARVIGFGTSYGVNYEAHADGENSPLRNDRYIVENAIPLYNGARFIDILSGEDEDEALVMVVFGMAL